MSAAIQAAAAPPPPMPLISRRQAARDLAQMAEQARALRSRMTVMMELVDRSALLRHATAAGVELMFALPDMESVCESLERAYEDVA